MDGIIRGEWLLMRIIESQLANFFNCEEVRDTIEKQKGFDLERNYCPAMIFHLFQSSHIWLSYFFHGILEIRKKILSMSCDGCDLLDCIIGLSSTTKNNSLCNHIMWWQIVFENWNRSVIDEGSTINDTGHLI